MNNALIDRRFPGTAQRKMLDYQEASKYCGTTPRYLRSLVQQRRIEHYKIGKRIKFSTADLDHFLDACKREAVR